MKRFIGLFAIVGLFILSGCFDTVEETTINDDGSGVVVSSIDMGKMLAALMAMGSGSDEKLKAAEKMKIDTTVFMKNMKDSIGALSDVEKKLIEKGTAHLIMDVESEKFSVSFTIPYSNPAEIGTVNSVLKKSRGKIMEKLMEKIMPGGQKNKDDEDMGPMNDTDGTPDLSSYFVSSYEKNKMTKKIDKEKFSKVEDDESLKSLKEMGQMGMPVSFKTVINLPKPAKKANGKGLTLSDDKKKVTIEGTLDDFFEDPSKFEYEIEY